MKKKIVFTGGGTAGHITPNIALFDELKNNFDCYYIGSKTGMEKNMISNLMPFFEIETAKLSRNFTLSNLAIPFKLIKGIFDAKKLLKKIRPNIVFSKGGFVAVPVVIASNMLKIPVITHESDYTLGLANKLIKNKCKYVCTSFENTCKKLKNGVYTGSIIRKSILSGDKNKIMEKYNFSPNKPNLLIIGGSLGSKNINKCVFDCAEKLQKKYNVLHSTGKNNLNHSLKFKDYVQVELFENISDAFSFADVVITRGGSNTLFELLALQKPMLVIPLSKKASRGDQILNANYFLNKKLANVLTEQNLNCQTLQNYTDQTLAHSKQLIQNMKKENINGTKKIAELIKQTAK